MDSLNCHRYFALALSSGPMSYSLSPLGIDFIATSIALTSCSFIFGSNVREILVSPGPVAPVSVCLFSEYRFALVWDQPKDTTGDFLDPPFSFL